MNILNHPLYQRALEVFRNPALDMELFILLNSALSGVAPATYIKTRGCALWSRGIAKGTRHDN